MRRGRDRQELGEPLDEPEYEGLGIRERVGIVTHAGEREHERETERRTRDAVHERAAHGGILRRPPGRSCRAGTKKIHRAGGAFVHSTC